MDGILTGREAAEALGVYARLGSIGARFDRYSVAAAVRSSAGRARVLRAVASALRGASAPRASRRSQRARTGLGRLRPASASSGSPGRPGPREAPAGGSGG